MKRSLKVALAALVAVLVGTGAASAVSCNGLTVSHVWVFAKPRVLVATVQSSTVPQSNWTLCSLEVVANEFTAEDVELCHDLYTQLLAAKATGATVQISFDDTLQDTVGDPVVSCDQVPNFNLSAVAPHLLYLRINP